ncbi:hypothetical protein ACSVBT_11875 [Afipia sp. TerB]
MRLILPALAACLLLGPVFPAHADSKVFLVANQPDGYGVDQCLAKGENCGAPAARAYCHAHHYAEAVSYRRVSPDELTAAVPQSTVCRGSGCDEYVAIICQR